MLKDVTHKSSETVGRLNRRRIPLPFLAGESIFKGLFSKGRSLLILEDIQSDEALAIELVRQGMPDFDWKICSSDSAADAVDVLSHSRFDAALVDLSLQDASGSEVVGSLVSKAPGLPIVVWTGCRDGAVLIDAAGRRGLPILCKDKATPIAMRLVLLRALKLMS